MMRKATTASTSSMSRSSAAGIVFHGSLDRPLATALTLLCLMYTTVTVITYHKVSKNDSMVITKTEQPQSNDLLPEPSHQISRKVSAENISVDDPAILKIQHTFPIHVGHDTVVIDHPGIALLDIVNLGKATRRELPADLPRQITVPQFFDESHGYVYNNNQRGPEFTVRHFLGDGESLLTPELASAIGSWYTDPNTEEKLETIYCSIASYRDPECTGTVEDLYARAEHPERIRVAIVDQRVVGVAANAEPRCSKPALPCETNPEQALCKYRHLIDVYELDARLAVGPVFGRHLAHRHYRGEYFAMQIDSHVRFTQHWDTDIIDQWRSARNEMAVLTTYPSDIQGSIEPGTYKNIHHGRPIMCASDFEGQGQYKHLRHGQQPEGVPGILGEPTLHPFWAAGFSFARGHFVLQVPYDQYLPMVFQGEEISIGLRGFTYGYDYYAPERSILFHMYAVKENEAKRKAVPLFWENSLTYQGVGKCAMRRLNSIIGLTGPHHFENGVDWDSSESHKYGLGNVRKKERFFDVFGIHVETQTVEHHLCRFVGKRMMKLFMPALRKNKMGLNYDLIDYSFVDEWPDEPDNGKVKKLKQKLAHAAVSLSR